MTLLQLLERLETPYCERLGPGWFAEPLNAISNLAFLITAVLAARWIQRQAGLSGSARALPWSIGEVGLASALYHTLRGPITFALDALSLLSFVLLVILVVLRASEMRLALVAVVMLTFLGLESAALLLLPQPFLHGSATYLVMLLTLLLLMALIARKRPARVMMMVPIALLFAAAILFRTIDIAVCPWLPIGTHFLWHLSAAAAAFYVIRFAVRMEAARSI
ncbi:MAG: ceramidase domain-containing protein [Anaerolineales bacterium]